jgi:hypothetical protein
MARRGYTKQTASIAAGVGTSLPVPGTLPVGVSGLSLTDLSEQHTGLALASDRRIEEHVRW